MPAKDFKVSLQFRKTWRDYASDGETCFYCGDVIFLGGKRMKIEFSFDNRNHWREYFDRPVCQSCSEKSQN